MEKYLLEEETLDEKKKKKPYSSITYTTGDIQKNIDHFNKMLGGKEDSFHQDGYLNGTINAGSPDGATCISGDAGGGDAGGCCESYELTEDKVFSKKAGSFVDIPDHIKLLPQAQVEDFISKLEPEQSFEVGYITPIYFYKELFDKFTLVKCTELCGYTGVEWREARTANVGIDQNRIDRSKAQINNPQCTTDYGIDFNKENNKVKSHIDGMRKSYGDVNKTVNQGNVDIYERDPSTGRKILDKDKNPIVKDTVKDLRTILFYPMPGSKPKVKYYVDLKNGKGFVEIPRDILVKTIYEKVKEITARDVDTGAIADDEDMTEMEINILKNVENKVQAVIDQDAQTIEDKQLSTGAYKPNVRALYTNQIYYLSNKNNNNNIVNIPGNSTTVEYGKKLMEEIDLQETKRYVRRYYMKPQEIFCSNKDEVLKALIDHEDEDCVIYTLINLGDIKDVSKLNNDDIIYYYEDGILYDKNHVRIMDYELSIKHEEERPHINPETTSDAKLADVYADRMTGATDLGEAFDLTFEDINAYGETMTEGKENRCCICGEEIHGYGNNAEPYAEGTCCDACNQKFVIPARLEQIDNKKEN